MGEFNKISEILDEQVFNKNACLASVKKAVAFGFWKNITGPKFAKFSKPYDIKGKALLVAVKNPAVMQELIFYKATLLEKIKNYFSPINIEIEEIRYDYKNWQQVSVGTSYLKGDESLEYYSKEEIEEVKLGKYEEEELQKVTNTISNLTFLDEKLRNSMKKNIINSAKAKKIRN